MIPSVAAATAITGALVTVLAFVAESDRRRRSAIRENLELSDLWKARQVVEMADKHEARAQEISKEYLTSAPPAPLLQRRVSVGLALTFTAAVAVFYRDQLWLDQQDSIFEPFVGGLILGVTFLVTRATFLDAMQALAQRIRQPRNPAPTP